MFASLLEFFSHAVKDLTSNPVFGFSSSSSSISESSSSSSAYELFSSLSISESSSSSSASESFSSSSASSSQFLLDLLHHLNPFSSPSSINEFLGIHSAQGLGLACILIASNNEILISLLDALSSHFLLVCSYLRVLAKVLVVVVGLLDLTLLDDIKKLSF